METGFKHHISMRKSLVTSPNPVLTKTADYALRALLVLARHGVGRSLPAESISEQTGTPPNYTSKTLYALARAGLLRSTRGPHGGFALMNAPGEITIAQVADVFADPPGISRCLLGTTMCDATNPCAAHERWKRVTAAARAPLDTTTLADLLVDAGPAGTTTPAGRTASAPTLSEHTQ